jgi:hypothetical protein
VRFVSHSLLRLIRPPRFANTFCVGVASGRQSRAPASIYTTARVSKDEIDFDAMPSDDDDDDDDDQSYVVFIVSFLECVVYDERFFVLVCFVFQ